MRDALFQIHHNHLLPTKICGKCYKSLNSLYKFREKCRQTHDNFVKFDPKYALQEDGGADMMVLVADAKVEPKLENFDVDEAGAEEEIFLQQPKTILDDYNNIPISFQIEDVSVELVDQPALLPTNKVGKETKLPCEQCGKFITKGNLKRHLLAHSAGKARPFVCKELECGKDFRTQRNLKDHIYVVHTNERVKECDKCGKKIRGRSALIVHMKYHGDPKLPCPHCTKLSYTKYVMRNTALIDFS